MKLNSYLFLLFPAKSQPVTSSFPLPKPLIGGIAVLIMLLVIVAVMVVVRRQKRQKQGGKCMI